MTRRILLFGLGVCISIFFLSMGPENRLKTTFYHYVDYFNINKRVINHLINDSTTYTITAECQLVYYNLTKDSLLTVLDQGKVNFKLSQKDSKPCQYYVIEKNIQDNILSVRFELCYYNNKSVRVMSFTINNEEICAL